MTGPAGDDDEVRRAVSRLWTLRRRLLVFTATVTLPLLVIVAHTTEHHAQAHADAARSGSLAAARVVAHAVAELARRGAAPDAVELGSLARAFDGALLPPDARVYVLDAAGAVVAAAGHPGGAPPADLALPHVRDVAVEGVSGDRQDARGDVVAWANVPGTPWRVHVAVPSGSVEAEIRRARAEIWLAALVAVGLVLLGALVLGSRIAAPVAALAAAARAGRRDEAQGPAPVAGPREIAEVALELDAALAARRSVERELREAARLRDEELAWEELVGAISRQFLAASADGLDREVDAALAQLVHALGLDRATLHEIEPGGARAIAWACRGGVPAPLASVRMSDFPTTAAQLLAGRTFCWSRREELAARAPADAAGWARVDAEAAVVQPIAAGGRQVGMLVLVSGTARAWPEALLRRIVTVGGVFANALTRMQADRALRHSEGRYRNLVESASDAILVGDAETGVILEANPRAAALTGRTLEELVGLHHTAMHPPDEVDERRAGFRHGVERTGREPRCARILRPDGTIVHVEINTSVFEAPGGARRLLGIFRDVTDRVRAEEETRRLQEFYATILENVREGILVTDASDRIRYVNRAQSRSLGVPREQLIGGAFGSEPAPRASSVLHEQYARARETLQPTPYEAEVERRDRAAVLQAGWFVPLVREGRFDGMLCTAEDVTERRAVEETLRHTQERFLQAQKMEAVGRLAGGVAHDFNNILSVILSYAELLQDELPQHDPRRADVDEIQHAARAGANLTRQLLAFSRKQVTEPRVVRLAELVGNAQKMLKRLIGEDVALEVAGLDSPGRVRVDPGHLEQVLLNLAVNARDAMPGGGRLSIAVGSVALAAPRVDAGVTVPPGSWMTLAVSDTGCGMDETTRAHAFEPFFSTKGAGKGTGLGLATVYGIVQQAGGVVALDSAPGRGTGFRVYLPAAAPAPEDLAAPAPAPAAARRPPHETVLVVEDDPALREVMRRVLSAAGYGVLAAASGDDALRAAEGHGGRLELLVTDVIMPGMNGRELARRLVADRPGLRVLFLSGYTDDILGRHGVLDAGTHLLHKPFTQPQLLEAVRRQLAQAPAAA